MIVVVSLQDYHDAVCDVSGAAAMAVKMRAA
jgi:hypothetical protein